MDPILIMLLKDI